MTSEDIKTSKKFICAGELARVFKSMICLFLTTSYILMRFKIVTEQEIEGDADKNIDGLTELATHLTDSENSCKSTDGDFQSTDPTDIQSLGQSHSQSFLLDVFTMISIGLSLV